MDGPPVSGYLAGLAPVPRMLPDPWFLLIGWTTVLAVSIGKGAFGGGLAMLGVPLLSFTMAPVEAAITMAPLVAFMDVFALGAFGRASWSRPDLAWLLPGLAVGIAIGAAVFALVDPRLVTFLIGTVTLGFSAHYFLRGRLVTGGERPVSRPLAVFAGAASGFCTFVAHSGGPPVAMYLLRRGLTKTVFAGTTVAFFTFGNFLKLPPYLVIGWDRFELFRAALWLAPAVPVGVLLGKALHDRLPQQRLFFWCYVILAAASVNLLIGAIRA